MQTTAWRRVQFDWEGLFKDVEHESFNYAIYAPDRTQGVVEVAQTDNYGCKTVIQYNLPYSIEMMWSMIVLTATK